MPESNTQTNNNRPDFCGPIEVNCDPRFKVDIPTIQSVIGNILADAGFQQGSISVAVVDDPTMHELNRRYLQHDYPTDVLSFVMECDREHHRLDGEIIVSYDTATAVCQEFNWDVDSELMLYIIHGTLHLTGMDDQSPQLRAAMTEAENRYLKQLGLSRSDPQD